MNFLDWCKLLILEQKMNFSSFGKYNRYRCQCLEKSAETVSQKLLIAQQVFGTDVSLTESQHNEEVIRKHND